MVLHITGEKMELVVQRSVMIDKVREIRRAKNTLERSELIEELLEMDEALEKMEDD